MNTDQAQDTRDPSGTVSHQHQLPELQFSPQAVMFVALPPQQDFKLYKVIGHGATTMPRRLVSTE
jgi:hypothetical protein